MQYSLLYAATFAVAAFAAPHGKAQHIARDIHYEYDVTTVTDYVYVTEYDEPTSTHKYVPPAVTTPPPAPPAPTTTPPPKTTYAPAPVNPSPAAVVVTYTPQAPSPTTSAYVAPVETPAASAPVNSGNSYLDVCNKYRNLYNLPEFEWSDQLTSNAGQTGEADGGSNEVHHLYSGSMAQVISPGMVTAVPGVNMGGDSPFELAYLAWMCEKSSDSQISALCPVMQAALNMEYSSTGHYDILTSRSYSKIGCAFTQNPSASSDSPYQGLWVCDLA